MRYISIQKGFVLFYHLPNNQSTFLFNLSFPSFYLIIANHPIAVYNRHKGYTASALLFNGTAPPTKGTLAQDAHAIAIGIKTHLAIVDLTSRQIIAAVSNGNKQYPNKHNDWKKPMVPPNKMTLTVRMMAPMERRVKTSCK